LLRIIARAHHIQARLIQNPKLTVHDIAREEQGKCRQPKEDIGRGYEIGKGQYLQVEDEGGRYNPRPADAFNASVTAVARPAPAAATRAGARSAVMGASWFIASRSTK
jgi:hypothetical protein